MEAHMGIAEILAILGLIIAIASVIAVVLGSAWEFRIRDELAGAHAAAQQALEAKGELRRLNRELAFMIGELRQAISIGSDVDSYLYVAIVSLCNGSPGPKVMRFLDVKMASAYSMLDKKMNEIKLLSEDRHERHKAAEYLSIGP